MEKGFSKSDILAYIALAQETIFPWVSKTPFGFPVVPEVYIIIATVSFVIGAFGFVLIVELLPMSVSSAKLTHFKCFGNFATFNFTDLFSNGA